MNLDGYVPVVGDEVTVTDRRTGRAIGTGTITRADGRAVAVVKFPEDLLVCMVHPGGADPHFRLSRAAAVAEGRI